MTHLDLVDSDRYLENFDPFKVLRKCEIYKFFLDKIVFCLLESYTKLNFLTLVEFLVVINFHGFAK